MRKTALCYFARPTANRFAGLMSILHSERSPLELLEFEEEEHSRPARRPDRRRIPKIAKAAANSPSLRANQDRLEESGRREFLRELVPLEMRPGLLRPD